MQTQHEKMNNNEPINKQAQQLWVAYIPSIDNNEAFWQLYEGMIEQGKQQQKRLSPVAPLPDRKVYSPDSKAYNLPTLPFPYILSVPSCYRQARPKKLKIKKENIWGIPALLLLFISTGVAVSMTALVVYLIFVFGDSKWVETESHRDDMFTSLRFNRGMLIRTGAPLKTLTIKLDSIREVKQTEQGFLLFYQSEGSGAKESINIPGVIDCYDDLKAFMENIANQNKLLKTIAYAR